MNNFGLITQNFGFQKLEVSVRKPELSVKQSEVSVQNPEVSGKTSVKVFFRNASVAKTQNFELLCSILSLNRQNFTHRVITIVVIRVERNRNIQKSKRGVV
jgi:formylmethanofuran dehydrogenase subunit A